MNGIIELLSGMAVSETVVREQSAQVIGTLVGCAFCIWLICVVVKALSTKTDDEKKKKEAKRKKSKVYNSGAGEFFRKYLPIIIIVAVFVVGVIVIALSN